MVGNGAPAEATPAEAESPVPHSPVVTTDVGEVSISEDIAASPNGSIKSTAESLRRTSSKIANLRAAFEGNGGNGNSLGALPKRRFDKSPSRPHEYETEIARLKDELDKELELRQAYEEKCAVLEQENAELADKFKRRDKAWETEVQREHGSLLQEKLAAQEEANNVHRQLTELKRSISAATHVETQVTDATFSSEMGILQSELQNWTVQHFRRVKVETTTDAMLARLGLIADRRQHDFLLPVFQRYDPALKLAFLQAVIMAYLMEVFEDQLLFGLSTQEEWQRSLKKTTETLSAVLTPTAFNKWRAITLNSLRQSDVVKASVDSSALTTADAICATLARLTDNEDYETRVSSLRIIVKRCISLAHLFRVQRARYNFQLPASGAIFDTSTMEDMSLDGDSPSSSSVICATFPSVIKLGDENGDNLQLRNVVLKAHVLQVEA